MGTTSGTKKPAKRKKAIKNYVTWFEISAIDFGRAHHFYETIFDIKMETSEVNNYQMALFPDSNGISGAVVAGEGSFPSDKGTLIYLNAGNQMEEILSRIEEAGGRVLMGKTFISEEGGHFALFLDSEGNKLALHSQ